MTTALRILVINGPNLNMLGTREPEVYGYDTLGDIETRCRAVTDEAGAALDWMQSNSEAVILDRIQQACLLYTSPSPRDLSTSRMPSSA